MRIAYLVNRYPATSHSFIRREIEAVEAAGAEVFRFSVRPADLAALPDPRDQAEVMRTETLLTPGGLRLLLRLAGRFLRYPGRGIVATRTAFARVEWKVAPIIRRVAYLAEAAELAARMRALKVDHLHAHFGTNPAMVARIASKWSSIPYSFTVHGPDEFDLAAPLDLTGKIADARFCVAISSFGRSQLMRWSAFDDWSKIEVVRCGVDEMFLNDGAPSPVPATPRLCAVARLSAQKGIPLLIEAAKRLRDEGRHFELVLIGDGEMRDEIERIVDRHGLKAIVRITGWVSADEVVAHLSGARAMVLPSFAEGLPVVIMEALALERPVVVTAIAGTPELVDHGCGWLIPAGSVDALTDAMRAALDASPAELAALGSVGRERVRDRHDASRNGRELYRLFQLHHDIGR